MKTKYFTNLKSHAMKNLTLKIALVAVATILGLNGFAQTNTGSAQWTVQTTVNDYVSTAGNKVTVGKTMPFWVWPSAAYNPDFDYTAIPTFATEAQISNNVLSTFAWSATGTAPVVTTTNDNYVTIQWPVADIGAQTISVTETPASGVCPATPVTFAVTVIGAPDFTITTGASTFGLTNEITHDLFVFRFVVRKGTIDFKSCFIKRYKSNFFSICEEMGNYDFKQELTINGTIVTTCFNMVTNC